MTLMGFQIASKVHEILIVASLSVIIFHAVRHELLHGDGLPLGLLGSGFNFGSFDFFFSKEFRGGLLNAVKPGHRLRKTCFVILLCVAGFIAALAGPSSATLIVPTSQTWQAGGTHFYLNGSAADFWPSDVSSDASNLQPFCSGSNATELGVCPAGGYLSVLEHWSRVNYSNFYDYDVPAYAKKLSGSRFYWPIHSPGSPIPPRYALGNARIATDFSPGSATFFVQPHAAATTLMQRIANMWWSALQVHMKVSDRQVDDRKIKGDVNSAITTIRCAEPRDLAASEKNVHFPTMSGRFDYADDEEFVVDTLNASTVDHIRFQWVHLPESFGAISIGAVFESPWSADTKSRVVLGCSAQAGWVPTSLYTDEYSFWTGWYPWSIQWGGRTPSWAVNPGNGAQSPTNGRVSFDDNWLHLLSPAAPITQAQQLEWNPSTIESIIGATNLAGGLSSPDGVSSASAWVQDGQSGISRTVLLESIISSVIADGLSRSGAYRIFQIEGPASTWPLAMFTPLPDFEKRIINGHDALQAPTPSSGDVTTSRIKMEITGFALKRSLESALSMVVLLAHIMLAVSHIIFVAVKRQSSNSWDSISELIALSQNSRPACAALCHTSAGISKRGTFGSVAKIRARATIEHSEHDHVELVFDDSNGQPDDIELPFPYGSDDQKLRGITTTTGNEDKEATVHATGSHPNLGAGNAGHELTARQQIAQPAIPSARISNSQVAIRHLSQTSQSTLPHSRSGSQENLIGARDVHTRKAAAGDIVQIDQAYG